MFLTERRSAAAFGIGMMRIRKYLHLNPSEFLAVLKPAAYGSIIMSIAGVAVKYLTVHTGARWNAVLSISAAIVTYGIVSYFNDKNLYAEIKANFFNTRPNFT